MSETEVLMAIMRRLEWIESSVDTVVGVILFFIAWTMAAALTFANGMNNRKK